MDVHIKRVSIEQGSNVQMSVEFHNFAELQWNPAITKTLLWWKTPESLAELH